MKVTNKECSDFMSEVSSTLANNSTVSLKAQTAAEIFIEKYKIDLTATNIKYFTTKFQRLHLRKKEKKNQSDDEEWNNKTFHEVTLDEAPKSSDTAGRKRSLLSDNPCLKLQRTILGVQVNNIEDFADKQNIP